MALIRGLIGTEADNDVVILQLYRVATLRHYTAKYNLQVIKVL